MGGERRPKPEPEPQPTEEQLAAAREYEERQAAKEREATELPSTSVAPVAEPPVRRPRATPAATSGGVPAVRETTARRYRIAVTDIDTGQVFEADLSSEAPLPEPDQAYPFLPAFRALATRTVQFVQRLNVLCTDDLKTRGATERRINGRLYRLEMESEWMVDGALMRSALQALCDAGELSQKEVDEACWPMTTTTYKSNNARLNALSVKRGGVVAETIAKYRRRTEGVGKIVEVT
jgi:hypothetical protein